MGERKKNIITEDTEIKELTSMRDELMLIDMTIEYCEFEYSMAVLISRMLKDVTITEIGNIIESAVMPYSIVTADIISVDRVVRNARCYEKLVRHGLSISDIVRHRLAKWDLVVRFINKDNALEISGIMNDPSYLEKIKKRWGNVEQEIS